MVLLKQKQKLIKHILIKDVHHKTFLNMLSLEEGDKSRRERTLDDLFLHLFISGKHEPSQTFQQERYLHKVFLVML